jgi:hypothetical protein
MSPELDKQLCERYPLVFKDRHASMRETAMCWGFEHGDGWFPILDTLCALLYAPYREAAEEYEYARKHEGTAPWEGADVITAVEVERKRLAKAQAAQATPIAVQVKEKFGTLRFYVQGANEQTYHYIEFAEALSARTCEECGAPGRTRGGGWVRTLCDRHEEERTKGTSHTTP